MAVVELHDVVLLGVVSLVHAWQFGMAATEVAVRRTKYKINAPVIDGPADFVRALRAQQNSLEFGVPLEMILWIAGVFVHQVPAAVLGLIYIYGRHKYIKGYIEEADKRIPGFWTSINAMKGLFALCAIGLINTSLKAYAGMDILKVVLDQYYGSK